MKISARWQYNVRAPTFLSQWAKQHSFSSGISSAIYTWKRP